MESLYDDDLELLLDDCECVFVDFSTFDNNGNLGGEQLKFSFPMVKIEKQDEYSSFPTVKIEKQDEYPSFPTVKIEKQDEYPSFPTVKNEKQDEYPSFPTVKIEKQDEYPSFPDIKVKIEEECSIFPDAKVKQEPELYFNWKEESTTDNNHLLEEALRLNRELQKDFLAVIDGCENTLEYNLDKQKELEKEIAILKKKILQGEETENDKTHKKPLLTISNFGAPYFKSNLVLEGVPPMNGDAEIARKLNVRPIMFPSRKIKMTDCEEMSLREAVKKEVTRLTFELMIIPEEEKLEEKLEIQRREGRSTKTTTILLDKLKRKIENLGENERELFRNPAARRMDLIRWDVIAFELFPSKYEYTAEFLRLWWKNHLRPDILKGQKSTEEKQALKNLLAKVDLNMGVSWTNIAKELALTTKSKIKRSPFDCFSYFQRRLNDNNRIFGWSQEDDAKLNYIFCKHVYLDSCGRAKVDWGEIRPHFLGRTVAQMWSHLKYGSQISDPSWIIKNAELRRQELARKAEMEAKLKPRGRPARTPHKVPLQEELRQLFRPTGTIKQRRQRILSLPGDGRRNGPMLAALCRLFGIHFDMTKLPKVEKGAWDPASINAFYESGIEEKDLHSFRILLEMIPEFPKEHDEYCKYYMSGESPPLESLLPPSLHTLAGLRGLLLWSDSIASQVEEKYVKLEKVESAEDVYQVSDADIQELQIEVVLGDPEADKRFLFFLESMFGLTGDIAGVW